jgi:hypothetical protein
VFGSRACAWFQLFSLHVHGAFVFVEFIGHLSTLATHNESKPHALQQAPFVAAFFTTVPSLAGEIHLVGRYVQLESGCGGNGPGAGGDGGPGVGDLGVGSGEGGKGFLPISQNGP